MFQKSSLQFLTDLKRNNHKDWFDKNRQRYETAKANLEEFTAEMIRQISRFDESIAHLQVKECLFRINRDIRFSKDKTPYKTNLSMYISKGGKKAIYPGYYFHLEPGKSHVSGGLWMPLAPELKKIRQEIDYNWDEFQKIVTARKFRSVYGDFRRGSEELLTRAPKGYEEDNPAIGYLRFKSWVVSAPVTDAELQAKDLAKKTAARYEALFPLINFFSRALDE